VKTFWRLLKLTLPFKWWIALAVLLGFATIGSAIGLMATSAYLISAAALHPPISALQLSIVGVRFFGLSRGVFRYLERLVSHQVTFRLLARLRVWFYQAVEPLAPARLMQYRSGDLLSRIVTDVESLQHFYIRVIAPPIVAGSVILLMWFFMASFEVRLAVVTVIFLLLVGLGLPLLTRPLSRGLGHRLATGRAELNVALVEGVQGAGELLIAGREATHQKRVQTLSRNLVKLQERETWINGLQTALAGLLINWSTLVILLIAIPLVNQGRLEGVYLAVLVLAGIASFEAVTPLPEAWQHLESSLAAARRLFELVDTEPVVPELSTEASSPTPKDFSLSVRNLSFYYNTDARPALDNISFTLSPGQKLAIVGPSGAGKSTIVNLLLRFWDYQNGEIRLGGYDLRQYQPDDVRRMMSVVSQHPHLFNDTVRGNLWLARPEASETELIRAAQQAQIHDFIQDLPHGYDTWLGEQGLRLSGGQRQRLAIARALLKEAPILILDEATANLDPLVEQEIMQTIHSLLSGRTVLIITHRLVGLERMDEILVLRAGHLIERGQHHDLLQAQGLYWQMWSAQKQKNPEL
jgi:thiol reductant ABC exporter CydC subunit